MAEQTGIEPIDRVLDEEAPVQPVQSRGKPRAVYKVYEDSKVPVSKKYGTLWKQRLDAAQSARKDLIDAWDEGIRYYNHDQLEHREQRTGRSGNLRAGKRRNRKWAETENLIFSGINSIMPAIYAKNPAIELTAYEEVDRPTATMCERLVNALASMRYAPGFNAKPRIKQCSVLSMLTNAGWIEINWVHRQDSNEEVLSTMQGIAQKLEKAQSPEEIKDLEGQLQATEDMYDIARPAGPVMRCRPPHDVIVDPNSVEPDHMDASWIMVPDMLPTAFVNAKYAERVSKGKDEHEEYKSLYAPTHVLPTNGADSNDDVEATVNNFKLIRSEEDRYSKYGFATQDEYDSACMTKVWYVYDRTSRRVFMYHDNSWTWPLWVWDDPLHLPRFFPLFKLSFLTPPIGSWGKGETTYVLDQQDAVNEIVDEQRRARQRIKYSVLYNGKILNQKAIEAVLTGEDGTARAIEGIPDGVKLDDLIWQPTPANIQYPQLFDTTPKMQSIDRVFGITEIMRGGQFKTNTTNEAIGTYNSVSATRLDDKIDSIEDFIGEVFFNMLLLCVQYMSREEVAAIIGDKESETWNNMTPEEFTRKFNMRVAGGSTQKPTSRTKKQEAIQVTQVLGQFANVSPVTLIVAMNALKAAFDDLTIREEDWQKIEAAIAERLNAPQGGGGSPPNGAAPAGAGPTPTGPGQAPAGAPAMQPDPVQLVAQVLDRLPPEARAMFGQLLARGQPAMNAIQALRSQ